MQSATSAGKCRRAACSSSPAHPAAESPHYFRCQDFADHAFNADDRAAELNTGSYESIPLSVRAMVNREFEEFVHSNIRAGTSFAMETTLRSTITFEQARLAKENGFRVAMWYVGLDTVERYIERVKRRAARMGHSASERTLRRIHASSLGNLPLAFNPENSGIEIIRVYDNSQFESRPNLALEARGGSIVRIADNFPVWLQSALGWSSQDLDVHRKQVPRARDFER